MTLSREGAYKIILEVVTKTTKHNITSYLNIFVKLSTKEHLFTNKKSVIKYTRDNVVVFLLFTQYQCLHLLPVRINDQIWIIFDVRFSERVNKLFGCFSHCSFQTFKARAQWFSWFETRSFVAITPHHPVLTKHSNEMI